MLSLFGRAFGCRMSILLTWSAVVKAMINCTLCWHLHWVIYGSLIELKRRVVGAVGEPDCARPPWHCLAAAHRAGRRRERRGGVLFSRVSVCFLFAGEKSERTHLSGAGRKTRKTTMKRRPPPSPAPLTYKLPPSKPERVFILISSCVFF